MEISLQKYKIKEVPVFLYLISAQIWYRAKLSGASTLRFHLISFLSISVGVHPTNQSIILVMHNFSNILVLANWFDVITSSEWSRTWTYNACGHGFTVRCNTNSAHPPILI